ncbi:MAG: hypothetical protein AB7N91_05645 [Candidatus Tectimicrobiota bacterium]
MNVPLRQEHASCGRGLRLRRVRTTLIWLTTSMFMLLLMLTPRLGATQDKEPPFITGLLDLPFSNYYLTPRGVIVENAGVTFQPLLILNANMYQGDGPLTNITLTTGVWNSIHSKTRPTANPTTTPNWNELDFIAALNVTMFKAWTFNFNYEYWLSPIDAFPATSLIQLKLSYADSFLKGLLPNLPGELTINPYINFLVELHNKTAAAATIDESFYFELGFTPKYVFAGYPLSIELPTYFLFPGDHFYSTNSTLGVFGTGVKVTAPLTFIRERYGKWSVHADLVYKYLANDGVVLGNTLSDTRNPVQVIGGLTLTF